MEKLPDASTPHAHTSPVLFYSRTTPESCAPIDKIFPIPRSRPPTVAITLRRDDRKRVPRPKEDSKTPPLDRRAGLPRAPSHLDSAQHQLAPIEACIFNERAADNGSPDLQGFGLTKRSFKMQTSIKPPIPTRPGATVVPTVPHQLIHHLPTPLLPRVARPPIHSSHPGPQSQPPRRSTSDQLLRSSQPVPHAGPSPWPTILGAVESSAATLPAQDRPGCCAA